MRLESEFWLNEAQMVAKLGIFVYDIKKDKWISSEILDQLFGIEPSKDKNLEEWLKTVHPSQRKEVELYLYEVIKNGEDFDKEYRVACEDDKIERWVSAKGKIYLDENGVPEKAAGTIHDISEIKKREKMYKDLYLQYQNKEALLVSLINSIPDLIFYKDMKGTYLGCNKAFEALAGRKRKNIIGCNDYDIFDKPAAEFFRRMDLKMIYNAKPTSNEELVKYPDGRYVFLDTLKTGYYDPEGNLLGVIGVSRDITEKNKKEELEESINEEKRKIDELKKYDNIRTEFFANISHELRTPVNVIFSAIQMQELMLKNNNYKDNSDNKYINMIKQNCYRLIRLINNLIDITKIDAGYFELNRTNCDIVKLIEDVTLSVADYIENNGVSIIFDTDIEERFTACDTEKMERIILNLLSNAVKFTPRGGRITVKIEDDNDYIFIKVKDTGIGIPYDKLNSIFERFVQVNKSLSRNHEGSGIGLSIVKSLVELHNGTIVVSSKEGGGSEFIIHMPCGLVDEKDNSAIEYEKKIDEGCTEKINIEFSDV